MLIIGYSMGIRLCVMEDERICRRSPLAPTHRTTIETLPLAIVTRRGNWHHTGTGL